MPQIILEHSSNIKNIDYTRFFSEIYCVVKQLPNIGTCKIRALSEDNYFIGSENGENAFAHLKVFMMPRQERTVLLRENLAEALVLVVKSCLNPAIKANQLKCYPTVEVGLLSEHYYWVED